MKLSIGHRLFASVLLAIVAVAVTAIALMRQNVMSGFSEYAVKIELDRLDQLSTALAARYAATGNWNFIAGDGAWRGAWIAREMGRLQQQRHALAPPLPLLPPLPPLPPAPAPPHAPFAPPALTNEPEAPPLPPPPVPPVPPEPVPLSEPAPVDELGLQERITLLDANGAYLAGRPIGDEAVARRTLAVGGKSIGYLAVARAARPSDAMSRVFLAQMKNSLAIIIAASLALSAIAAMLLAAHFRKPIERLVDGARELAQGRFDTRLPDQRSDELGELARSFNQLAHKLESAQASRRQWVADTSHELRTPLSVLRAQLEAAQDGVRPASAASLAAMLRQVLSLNVLIDQLYALAQADLGELAYQRQRTDLWQLACEQAGAFEDRISAAGMSLHLGPAPAISMVAVDHERLRQVLANLFENSIRYAGPGARIVLSACTGDEWIEIMVDDSGPGVPEAALSHLLERFYRVEGSRGREHGGAGLGLALCQRIVDAHQGRMTVARSPLGGLRAAIRLPLEQT
ncbi:MAG: HAMP domain-containing protein [Massilia sp.]|nr:HAMP domain-containing protein [Massilia sp.]